MKLKTLLLVVAALAVASIIVYFVQRPSVSPAGTDPRVGEPLLATSVALGIVARSKSLQVADRAFEGFGEPRASERDVLPIAVFLQPDFELVRLTARVVEVDPEPRDGRASRAFELQLRHLVTAPEAVGVIGAHQHASLLPVVEQAGAARIAVGRQRRVAAAMPG